jgi:hypothetical protein
MGRRSMTLVGVISFKDVGILDRGEEFDNQEKEP